VSFAAITLCVASQRVFIVIVYFVIDTVRYFRLHPLACMLFRVLVLLADVEIGNENRNYFDGFTDDSSGWIIRLLDMGVDYEYTE
jgi:hypothetical protein